jgi:hypothetical protein
VPALIFGAILGICALVILSVVLVLRSKNGSQINPQDTESNQGNLSSDQARGVSELKGSNQGASCKRV